MINLLLTPQGRQYLKGSCLEQTSHLSGASQLSLATSDVGNQY